MAIIREYSEADAAVEEAAAVGDAGADIVRPGHQALPFSAANSAAIDNAPSALHRPTNSVQHISISAKNAAMQAFAQLPPLAPVASISYESGGRLLVIADEASQVPQAIVGLDAQLTIAVLWIGSATPPTIGETEIVPGKLISLRGYLGAFELVFEPNADGAATTAQTAPFDLVLDLRAVPMFAMHQPPQGYFHAPDQASLARARAELPDMVGEFEKPKFFAYKESICAHSRSKKTGCNKCIDICSAEAISSFGDIVKVDPHLCMGCGACATVCPSGAMSYQYPFVADRGSQLKTMLNAYRVAAKGQGAAPVVLFHNATDGREAIVALAKSGDADADGLPGNFLPLETWHIASTGLDVLLGVIAYGAGHVAVLATGDEAPQYLAALKTEMALGETILHALGFSGAHFSLLALHDGAISAEELQNIASGETVPVPAGFNLSNDKRGTLEFVIEHFMRHAKVRPAEIALPAGSLYGALNIDKQKCTMCMACVGACPESALMDGGEIPQLRFLERNCVQCGLCENTCPENAIALFPRLLLGDARKTEVVLNDAEPFDCISCGKPLGTKQMIDNMLGKLAGHSMFQGEGKLKRLQMCADCRVVDMMSNKQEYSILTGKSLEQQS